jgi:rod shape-determining protein MreC
MDLLISRFRNLTVLLVVISAQLLLLAYQVKTNQEVRLLRVWTVTAITPLAKVIEGARGNTTGFFRDYFILLDVKDENKRLKSENGRLKLENQFLKTELSTADRARALSQFQQRSPSRTLPARIIGNTTGTNSRVVYVDRGSNSGVQRGMGVITPDGIVGKVLYVFPTASQVQLMTDATFGAGVISQKNRVHGVLKGRGEPTCIVEGVQNEEKVEAGEWFFTSGEDRVFPKGLPVGQVSVVRNGKSTKDIYLVPSGFQNGFEEVLIVLEGAHQPIPEVPTPQPGVAMTPPPPAEGEATSQKQGANGVPESGTDADKMLDRYKKIGDAEGHTYGGYVFNKPPNFNINPDDPKYKKQAAQNAAAKAAAAQAPGGPADKKTPPPKSPESDLPVED